MTSDLKKMNGPEEAGPKKLTEPSSGGDMDLRKQTEPPSGEDSDLDDLDVPPLDGDFDMSLPIPPDGGYGWVIVFASLVTNIIVDGVCYSFGVFYLEFLDYFKEGASKTAWVGSLLPGMYLGMGPVVSALANKYGCRSVTIVGSVMSALSFIAATFSPNINCLIITYGIIGGISFGLMYLPSIVIVGFYFDQKRALATGIAVCGSGVGTFVFAPLSQFLITQFGWKGGLWIIAGICLNGVICGALFRPLTPRVKTSKPKKEKKIPKSRKKPKEEKPLPNTIMKKIMQEKSRLRTISTGSLDGTVITKDNKLIKDPELIKKINLQNKMQPLVESEKEEIDDDNATNNANNLATNHIVNKHLFINRSNHKSLESLSNKSSGRERTNSDCSEVVRRTRNSNSISSTAGARGEDRGSGPIEATRPMYRQDIFYTGSVHSISEFRSSQDMGSYVKSVTNIPKGHGLLSKCLPFTSVLREMFDFSLMKSPTFSIICVSNFLAMAGFFTPFVYTTAKAISIGEERDQATLLISMIGIANTVGRVAAGWFSDRPWANALQINNVALILAGVTSCVVPYLNNYPLLAIYCVVFGLCIACYISLRTIILVDLLGLEHLTNAFGIILLFSGLATIVGSPLAGFFVDLTGSFSLSYIISGIMVALSGAICVPIKRIALCEKRREKMRNANDTAGSYELV